MVSRLGGKWLASVALVLGCFVSTRASADEPWLLDAELTGGLPITEPQREWFSFGGSLAFTVSKPLVSWFSLAARVRAAAFLDGDTPTTPGVDDPGLGMLSSGQVGFIVRLPQDSVRRGTGLWVDGVIGGGLTGSSLRPMFEGGVGYGFYLSERTAIGPVLRYLQVLQSDAELAPSDARIGLVGVRLSFNDAPEIPPEKRPPPPPDRDGDGIADAADACIDLAEDFDDFRDDDGCPEPDNDQDGVPDAADGCPNISEDFDGFRDDDGCLDDDNDDDGIADELDKCPLEPETLNGVDDEDGCPDQGLIVMQDDRIVLEERVLFDPARSRVRSGAAPVLEAIVNLWKQHPEWTRVRIEGHADATGNAAFNQKLSERRAANVREALIKLGMRADVIVAEGFGSTKLLTQGTTDDDHRKNRRVEFVVVARYDDIPPQPATPPEIVAPTPEAAGAAPASDESSTKQPDGPNTEGEGDAP
jgi:outer membrane protein OmpA-like peptidoglycan-associated protein